jgi:hypothetical protein
MSKTKQGGKNYLLATLALHRLATDNTTPPADRANRLRNISQQCARIADLLDQDRPKTTRPT